MYVTLYFVYVISALTFVNKLLDGIVWEKCHQTTCISVAIVMLTADIIIIIIYLFHDYFLRTC